VILCPNLNIGHLRNTVTSANIYYPDASIVIILPDNCNETDLDTSSKLKQTYKAGKTIASMINCGIKYTLCPEWNFIIFSKGWMRNKMEIKYSYFVENEKDILFSITNHKHLNFADVDINGLLVQQKTFKNIGDFPDIENFQLSKLIWATKAMEKGCKFKGIVGAKIF
jgi:hypothetical protein